MIIIPIFSFIIALAICAYNDLVRFLVLAFKYAHQKRWLNQRCRTIRIILKMGKDENKEVMGKVYREFSRQKYNKYKHQFPKMRESEIVSKIIREWDSLDAAAKHKLKKMYKQSKALPSGDLSESETAKKSEEVRLTEQGSSKKEEPSAHLELAVQEEGKASAQKSRQWSQQLEDRRAEEQAKGKASPKHKAIGKMSGADYHTFFRHYYEKYSSEHPRWRASQITSIIKLQWRKNKQNRLASSKFRKGKLERSTKSKKITSGKHAFRKYKNLSSRDTSLLWKHLPLQSRRFWEGEGQGKPREIQKQYRLILKANGDGEGRSLDFLTKTIC